jgi:hypothetical protein
LNKLPAVLLCLLGLVTSGSAAAQDDSTPSWDGVWVAEGTFFSIAVSVDDNLFRVAEVESMGFEWSAAEGFVAGATATIQVFYAGASAIVTARLVDSNTAVAMAERCLPDYMVVCALAKDRQARFVKLNSGD